MHAASRYLLIHAICWISFFAIAGCNQKILKAADESSATARATAFVPDDDSKTTLIATIAEEGSTLDDVSKCTDFHLLVQQSLDEHLFRTRDDKDALLAQSISYINAYPNDHLYYDRWKKLYDNGQTIHLPQSPLAQCQMIESLAKKFKDEDFKHLSLDKREHHKIVTAYLRTFHFLLNMTDGGFSKLDRIPEKSDEAQLALSTGLVFFKRPDYEYPLEQINTSKPRHPNYLFIQAVYPSNQLSQNLSHLIGKHVTHICLQPDACEAVSLRSFAENLALINGQKNSVILQVKDPVSLNTQTYRLPLQQLKQQYSYSFTHPSEGDEPPIFVIKIVSFYSSTLSHSLRRILTDDIYAYQKKYGVYPAKIVVDLRNNGGGYVIQAAKVLENFLPEKSLVNISMEVVSKAHKEDMLNKDSKKRIVTINNKEFLFDGLYTGQDFRSRAFLETKPKIIVVLNRWSASASEIFAAAMKDHQAALIIGEKSFGKGIMQKAQELTLFGNSNYRRILSDSYFFSPKGTSNLFTPQLLHKEHNDPFNQAPYINIANKLFLYNLNNPGEALITSPQFSNHAFEPDQPLLENQLIDAINLTHLPNSCTVPEDFTHFNEEQDCLLDIAKAYFTQWSDA